MFNFFKKKKKIQDWQPSSDMILEFKLYAKKSNLSFYVIEALIEEYKRFMILAKNYSVSPSKQIDDFWRFHILRTKDYTDFCNEYVGRYIHHTPSTTQMEEQYKKTFELYYKVFEEIPPSKIWPLPRKKDNNNGIYGGSGTVLVKEDELYSTDTPTFNITILSSNPENTATNNDESSFSGGDFGGSGAGNDWSDGSSFDSADSGCGGE